MPRLISFLAIVICLVFTARFSAANDLLAADLSAYKSSSYASAKWNSLVEEGIGFFHAGDFEKANASLYKAFNAGCESPIVLFQMALINEYSQNFYSSLEYYKQAQENFRKANGNHRYSLTWTENYARALYMSGKKNEALPLLIQAAKKSKSFWLMKMLGMLTFEKGDTLNATSYFERAVRLTGPDVSPKDLVEIYGLLGRMFYAKGEMSGALRNYSKVLEMDPANAEANRAVQEIKKQSEQNKMMKMMKEMEE